MPLRPANLVHTDEADLVESTPYGEAGGSTEPWTRSSAVEHALHTGGVTGSIPVASTIPPKRWRAADDPEFQATQAAFDHYGFVRPTISPRGYYVRRVLYVIECAGFLKIGVADDLAKRIRDFEIGNPLDLTVRCRFQVPGPFAIQSERQVHAVLAAHRHRGEWFEVDVSTAREVIAPVVRRARFLHERLAGLGYDRHFR